MLHGKVLVGKGKWGNKDEWLYLTNRDGSLRTFASTSEMKRAAFQQFGDDLNVEGETVNESPR